MVKWIAPSMNYEQINTMEKEKKISKMKQWHEVRRYSLLRKIKKICLEGKISDRHGWAMKKIYLFPSIISLFLFSKVIFSFISLIRTLLYTLTFVYWTYSSFYLQFVVLYRCPIRDEDPHIVEVFIHPYVHNGVCKIALSCLIIISLLLFLSLASEWSTPSTTTTSCRYKWKRCNCIEYSCSQPCTTSRSKCGTRGRRLQKWFNNCRW